MELFQQLYKGFLPAMDFSLWFLGWIFKWVASLIQSSWLVLTIILFTSRELLIFLKSELPLCLDDFMVAPPYSLVAMINSLQLGLQPEATLSNATRGPYFLPELLAGCIDGHLLSIQTCEAVTGCWLGSRVNSTVLQVTAWIWLITTLVSVIPPDLHSQPVIRGGCSLDWTGRKIDEPRVQMLGAVAGHQLNG